MEVRVMVNELPKTCKTCLFQGRKTKKDSLFSLICIITQEYTKTKKRPNWCPLEIDEKNK